MKRRGKIAAEIGIGGLIEIHGKGGRGTYWTNGCVALANEDMNLLYSLARKGTPILIIGSSISLEKALKNYGYAKN
ncbi:MAG: L,D-transpeptidase [Odoribacter sp.]|nr:L,D-transpeptidase [Odoribacter sp.]